MSASPASGARIVIQGRSAVDGSTATLVVIHEENASRTIHGLGVAGIALSMEDVTVLAEVILARRR